MFKNPKSDANKSRGLLGELGDLSCKQISAVEFKYRKNSEIFGEGESAEYLYQVIEGAVRSHKLLSDGRRQIGALTWLAMSSGSKLANTIASRPKPSLIPPFGF